MNKKYKKYPHMCIGMSRSCYGFVSLRKVINGPRHQEREREKEKKNSTDSGKEEKKEEEEEEEEKKKKTGRTNRHQKQPKNKRRRISLNIRLDECNQDAELEGPPKPETQSNPTEDFDDDDDNNDGDNDTDHNDDDDDTREDFFEDSINSINKLMDAHENLIKGKNLLSEALYHFRRVSASTSDLMNDTNAPTTTKTSDIMKECVDQSRVCINYIEMALSDRAMREESSSSLRSRNRRTSIGLFPSQGGRGTSTDLGGNSVESHGTSDDGTPPFRDESDQFNVIAWNWDAIYRPSIEILHSEDIDFSDKAFMDQ